MSIASYRAAGARVAYVRTPWGFNAWGPLELAMTMPHLEILGVELPPGEAEARLNDCCFDATHEPSVSE